MVRPFRQDEGGRERGMRRSNLMAAGASAVAGALAVLVTTSTGGNSMGYLLGGVLLANAFVRYQLAQRQGR